MDLTAELERLTCCIAKPGLNPDGSYTRLPFSQEYFSSQAILKSLMEKAGLQTKIDSVGNLTGLLPGTDPDSGFILTGSHLDTVKNGGLFDGALGIIASLLCAVQFQQNNVRLRHGLIISALNAEEGSPLGGTFGSRAMMGLVPDGSLSNNLLEQYGINSYDLHAAAVDASKYKAYLELHIEQGERLEKSGTPVGIVSGIVGITRYQITLSGESNHAGTTPMAFRRDALTAAARLILFIHEHALHRNDNLVATVGQLALSPGAATIIPGEVKLTLEIRHMDQTVIDKFVADIKEFADELETVHTTFNCLVKKPSVCCSSNIQSAIRKVCKREGIQSMTLSSGAGHDSNAFGQRMPVGMIFVPSHLGLSHCKEEWTDWSDAVPGCKVLYQTILELDKSIVEAQ